MTTPIDSGQIGAVTSEHLFHSNKIENVHGQLEIDQSMMAWRFIEHYPRSLEVNHLLAIHNIIMMNHLPDTPGGRGSFRRVNVTVGYRHCPHFLEVPRLVDGWLLEMQDWKLREPKDMHIKFEHIHPFVDGNGRTGRMLMWWHEVRLSRPATLITYEDRWNYYKWF